MNNQLRITEDNLIGSIATAILELSKFKTTKSNPQSLSIFVEVIKFLDFANNDGYEKLLYDKSFIISESDLKQLHNELVNNEISKDIDFQSLIKKLSEINTESTSETIDETMNKLTEIAKILWQVKKSRQLHDYEHK